MMVWLQLSCKSIMIAWSGFGDLPQAWACRGKVISSYLSKVESSS